MVVAWLGARWKLRVRYSIGRGALGTAGYVVLISSAGLGS
jgi:hypothetical protein